MIERKCNHKWESKTIYEPVSNSGKNLKRRVKYVCSICGEIDIKDVDEQYQDMCLHRFVAKHIN